MRTLKNKDLVFYMPTSTAEDWRRFLADPELHWKDGYSAKALAYRWEIASGFPNEVLDLFKRSSFEALFALEPLIAIPEYQVPLPPAGGKPSCNDLLVLASNGNQLTVIMVEGKVAESFGPTLDEWLKKPSAGKTERLEYLKSMLGLSTIPGDIRYQLLHRTASAIIEAGRFNARNAVMLVHSFSREDVGFDDYSEFLSLYGKKGGISEIVKLVELGRLHLFAGWAKGPPA